LLVALWGANFLVARGWGFAVLIVAVALVTNWRRFDFLWDALAGPAALAWPAAAALLTVALLGVQVWAVGRLEPLAQIQGLLNPPTGASTTARRVPVERPAGWIGPSWLVRGHGIGWASLYRAAALLRHNRSALLVSGWTILLLFPCFIFGALKNPQEILPLLILAMFPAMPTLPAQPQRLYLLGVDYRAQMRYRLWTFWTAPGLLLCLLFLGLLALFGTDRNLALGMAAACLGLALFRAGWWAWPSMWLWPGRSLLVSLFLPALALALAFWPGQWQPDLGLGVAGKWLLFGLLAGGLGLAGVIVKLVRLDESTLRARLLAG
jgi:hypothetical protein